MPAMALPDRPLLAERDVDTDETRSISFGSPKGSDSRVARARVPVGPGRSASTPSVSFPIGEVVREFPVQLAKVQRPPLRRETLRRERLLDWLKVQIHHRVVLVTAEAGYGKTTLLADFARYHRRPTMWYRLDEEDRNWVSFLHYLVAAGREIEPGFGGATKGLLAELGVATGPSRDTIIATFMRDLQALGQRGAALIVDDYHLVDDVPDVRVLIRELVQRAPERLSLVFVSRQQPSLALARLRTLGEVAELDGGRPRVRPRRDRAALPRYLQAAARTRRARRPRGPNRGLGGVPRDGQHRVARSVPWRGASVRSRDDGSPRAAVRLPGRGGRRRPRRRHPALPDDHVTLAVRRSHARRGRKRLLRDPVAGAHRGGRAARVALDRRHRAARDAPLSPARPGVPRGAIVTDLG